MKLALILLATLAYCQGNSPHQRMAREMNKAPGAYMGPNMMTELHRMTRGDDTPSARELQPNEKLLKDLFGDRRNGYNSDAVPNNAKVEVTIVYLCAQYDPKTHILTSRVWQRTSWNDTRISWNPNDYGGIRSIAVNAWYLWRPDLKLYNSIEHEKADWDVKAWVSNEGHVIFVPPVTYTTLCGYKGQSINCTLQLGSWAYDSRTLDLGLYKNSGFDTTLYNQDCPYKITKSETKIQSDVYEGLYYKSLVSQFVIQQI